MDSKNIKKISKRKNVLLVALVFLFSLILGSTAAWFTSMSELKETIKFGTISVNATTDSFISSAVQRDGGIVMPGDEFNIQYNLKNEGEDAYFLVKVSISNSQTNAFDTVAGFYVDNSQTGKLQGENDKRVGKLSKNSAALQMAHEVSIPLSLDNTYQDVSATVSVVVYAIQQANLTETEAYNELMNLVNYNEAQNKNYKIINNVAYSYWLDGEGNEVGLMEVKNSVVVNPQNVQNVLDGDINGKTIVFSEGTYDKVLIRPSKSTATVYKTIADQPTVFGEQVDISSGTSGLTEQTYHYLRKLENVTFVGTEDAVFTHEFRIYAGPITHVDTAVEHYDAVRGMDLVGTTYQYRPHFDVKNVTFTGLNFDGNLGKIYFYVVPYGESNTKFENITIKNCSFLNNTTDETKTASIHLDAGTLSKNVFKNIEIKDNIIDGGRIGIRVSIPDGISITNNTITNTYSTAIAIYGDGNASNVAITGAVNIIGNTITHCSRPDDHYGIRVYKTIDATVIISDNTLTDCGYLKTDTNTLIGIAVQKFNGKTYTITNNTLDGVTLENVYSGVDEAKLLGIPYSN